MKHNYLIFFLFVFSTTGFAQTLEDDRLALIAFYQSTNGDSWTNKTGWNLLGTVGDNPCGWFGVSCEGGRVTELNLDDNHVTGTFPIEIGNLSALKRLSIFGGHDGFHGRPWDETINSEIPEEMGNLANLEYLNLDGNALSGTIPSTIGNLLKLTYLDLSYYRPWPDGGYGGGLYGNLPVEIGNLVNLKYLRISDQQLTGIIPEELGNLVNLETLDLGFNVFSDAIPASLGNLLKLKDLNLSYSMNALSKPVKGLLTGGIPFEFRKMTRLSYLGLYNQSLSGSIPDFSNIFSGAVIYLSGNSFTFSGIEENVSVLGRYDNQDNISIQYSNGRLSVNVGGTITNNTYKWYKNNQLVATNIGDESYTVTGTGTYKVIVTNSIATNLKLTSESYETPLPVTLASFEGKNKSATIVLTWKTTSETTNKGFEIERSKDAINFENIGFIDGNGDSKATNDYSFLDKNPFPLTYYRLKQIDYDGKFEYSRIIYVKKDDAKLSFYPNPAKSQLFVSGLEKEENVTIHNIEGRLILDQKLQPSQPINTSNFSNGLYVVKVGGESRKVVIQN